MESLRVPKHRACIDVTFADGTHRKLDVFLADSSQGHAGPERVSDLLSEAGVFVPAQDEGRLLWVNTANVLSVRLDAALDPQSDVETLPTEHEVEIVLSDGGSVRGLTSYLRPEDHSRLTDYLNDPAPFLRLLDGKSVVFVNKRHAIRVTAER